MTTDTISGVTTHRYRGRGTGAPTFACADGSTYIDQTPGAASAFYAWVAK